MIKYQVTTINPRTITFLSHQWFTELLCEGLLNPPPISAAWPLKVLGSPKCWPAEAGHRMNYSSFPSEKSVRRFVKLDCRGTRH